WEGADGKIPTSFKRTSGDQVTEFTKTADGKWTDGKNSYDDLYVDPQSGKAVLSGDGLHTRRFINADGTEIEAHLDQNWKLESRVERGAVGRVTAVEDSQRNGTKVNRDKDGNVISVISKDGTLELRTDGRWANSTNQNAVIDAALTVDDQGRQIWKGTGDKV